MKIFTGKPRAGKSVRAVKYIRDSFITPTCKEYKKYHNLYTNIGGFKHDKVNEMLEEYPIEIEDEEELFIKKSHKLDWDKFYVHLQYLHKMAKEDKSDDELLEYCKKHNINNSMLIIDECYRYFKKTSDPVLVWLLAYHGHLGMDIILIIHNLQLMHSDYKAFTETFIDAQPKNKGYSDNILRYFHYASEYYSADQKYETSTLKADPALFALYKSGDLHNPKKIIFKYVIYLLLVLSFVLGSWYVLYQRFMIPPNDNINVSKDKIISNDSDINYDTSSSDILDLTCNSKVCFLTNSKLYFYHEYSIGYILFLMEQDKIQKIYYEKYSDNLVNFIYEYNLHVKNQYLSSFFILKKSNTSFSNTVHEGLDNE